MTRMVLSRCPSCSTEEEVVHEVIKVKSEKKGIYLIRCLECGHTHLGIIERPIAIKAIVSRYEESEVTKCYLFPSEVISKGEKIETYTGELMEITAIDSKGGKRVDRSIAEEIECVWGKSLETPARVGVSLIKNGKTTSWKIELPRHKVISVGTIIEIDGKRMEVFKIRTVDKTIDRGRERAQSIKRLYCREIPPRIRIKPDIVLR